jgi:hypothetical protein
MCTTRQQCPQRTADHDHPFASHLCTITDLPCSEASPVPFGECPEFSGPGTESRDLCPECFYEGRLSRVRHARGYITDEMWCPVCGTAWDNPGEFLGAHLSLRLDPQRDAVAIARAIMLPVKVLPLTPNLPACIAG